MADSKGFLSRFCEPRSILPSPLLRLISPKHPVYRLRRLSNAYHLFTALIYILQLVAGLLLANTKHGTRVPRYSNIFTILYRYRIYLFSSHFPRQNHRKIKVS